MAAALRAFEASDSISEIVQSLEEQGAVIVHGLLDKPLRTRLGALLDPIADKLLILAVFVSAAVVGLLPWWLTGLVILRDLVIVGGALAYRLLIGPLQITPTLLSKANMALQIGFLVLLLAGALSGGLPVALLKLLMALVAGMALGSGLQYVLLWSRKARLAGRRGA